MDPSHIHIPESDSTVDVSIIDTTLRMTGVPGEYDMDPVYPGFEFVDMPGFSFLIEHHSSGRRILFDLGLRDDFRTAFNPSYVHALLEEEKIGLTVQTTVPDILAKHGVQLVSIEAIVLSHHHFDHIGDPSRFPSSTKLVVGPGFTDPAAKLLPGYPTDLTAQESVSDAFSGRVVQEVDFSITSLTIGTFAAHDYFDDGSLYILRTPGHTHSHISALARTSAGKDGVPSTFLFLGGDIVHHCPLFRPSTGIPMPPTVEVQDEHGNLQAFSTEQVGKIHRLARETGENGSNRQEPFCLTTVHHADTEKTKQNAQQLARFDAMDNVMICFAHDSSLLGVVEFFPAKATEWQSHGWKEKCRWNFLRKFKIQS